MKQLEPYRNVHFIGIGGAGMSAIATILLARGWKVSGSDVARSSTTRRLEALGARIDIGHRAENVKGADLVVTSTAIYADNPERVAAMNAGIPIWRRARVLAAIMAAGKSVAVSGTHGKTTTTSMTGLMLTFAGMDPTVLIGGELNDFGGNARAGSGEWVVAEADESDASFLEMNPDRTIVTNVEADHLDYYKNYEAIVSTFAQFFDQMREGGKLIACADDPGVAGLLSREKWPVVTYGLKAGAEMTVESFETNSRGGGARFSPVWRGEKLGEMKLGVAGRHNILNALGALACCLDIGAPIDPLVRALASYRGAQRRWQIKGSPCGVTIIDDYAHHPTEIRATLAVARGQVESGFNSRVVSVFQPHRYSRTQALAGEFGPALQGADLLVVTDVYSAGEKPIDGVSGLAVWQSAVDSGHRDAHYLPTLDETRAFLSSRLKEGDLFLTLGAGNVWQVGEALLAELGNRHPATAKA
ncbi:UDP-N-acetylmuramate--L-alanine ligase [bacterium]|nr:UDP-N-acetylmuramate--L-alanine ligase [bacterium]